MRKFFLFITALCCTVMISAQEIGTWSGFRKGAASFTFDDGAPCHVSDVGPMFDHYGYRATFYLVTNWNPDWEGFQALADKGHEVGSHSKSHPQNMAGEEKSSKDSINAHIKNHPCLTVAYPNCNVPDESAVLQNYIAGRICNGSWQGLSDDMEKNGPENWAKVPAIMTGANGTNDFKGKMQSAVIKGGWVVFMTHGFEGKNNGMATYSPTPLNAIEDALKWAQQNDADIWIAPLRDVAMYIKERNAASFTETSSTATSKTYSLTHSIADAVCAYQYPLSVKVPNNGWTKVEVTQGETKLASKINEGYIYFDAIPNGGDIVVQPSTEAIENVVAEPAATKRIEDGQILILRGEKTYTLTGQEVQ